MQSDDVSLLCSATLGLRRVSGCLGVSTQRRILSSPPVSCGFGSEASGFRAWGSHVSALDLQPVAPAGLGGQNTPPQSKGSAVAAPVPSSDGLCVWA